MLLVNKTMVKLWYHFNKPTFVLHVTTVSYPLTLDIAKGSISAQCTDPCQDNMHGIKRKGEETKSKQEKSKYLCHLSNLMHYSL
uniref:Uncharacterized protein n=1 Tax=Arundo donax TaxID=35708 RepID=A0A0A9GWM9_ARUDO